MTKEEAISVFKDKLNWANQNRYPYVSQREAEAYRMAIEALEQTRWIPVSERLPEAEYGESDSVLVCFEDETQDVLYFNGGNWCYPTGETYISVNHKNGWHNKVVAWMPLPKSYKTEESEGYEINRQNN